MSRVSAEWGRAAASNSNRYNCAHLVFLQRWIDVDKYRNINELHDYYIEIAKTERLGVFRR